MDPPDQPREQSGHDVAPKYSPEELADRKKRIAEIIRAMGFGRAAEREANARNRQQPPPDPDEG